MRGVLTYESPPPVLRSRNRVFAHILLVLAGAYAIWFTVVMTGEQQGWTDEPGLWAYTTTLSWALIGTIFFGLVAIFFLALLVTRESPPKTYMLPEEEHAPEASTPDFLEGAAAAESAEAEPSTEAQSPPQP